MEISKNILLCILHTSLLVLVGGSGPYVTEKPSYMMSCQIKDPEFTKCSTQSIQKVMDAINENNGLPGLDSLPPLDPLYVNRIRVDQSGTQAINLKVELSKVVIGGFKKIKIVESRVFPKDYHWETKIFLPKMTIAGAYALKGRILLINMNGRGNMTLGIDNIKIDLYTTVRLYEKGGFTFYNVTSTSAKYKIDKLSARFDNLFNGNKQLEESTNAFFNQNWETLNEALQPIIQSTISEILLKYLRAIFHYIPANYFVSDIPTSTELYGN